MEFIGKYEFAKIRKQDEKNLLRKHFDLLRNSHSTVPVYADECELLVFEALLTTCRRPIMP